MRTGRTGIVAVLIISLVLAGVTRDWARSLRGAGSSESTVAAQNANTASLANMNSFALALLLGGLRGPLVMVLWTQSEQLKNERNLEDFDTYVEWIRLLQPEFDTVHIFQVWNKAYNISVQMASWSNKYTAILDALEYAHRVLAERPNDINMIYAIASLYFDKLGNAAEKDYYRKRVREESLPHVSKQKLAKTDPSWRRLDLDAALDTRGMILPQYLKATNPRPKDLPADSEWNDGAELQYLAKYQPLPYGISTFGFAYNYHKVAQVLQSVGKLKHANLSELVVDSRPALALKGWSEDEWEVGRRIEIKAFNAAMPAERRDMELASADIALDTPFSEKAMLEQAIFSYNLGARLAADSISEYERHLLHFATNFTTYQSHMDSMRGQNALMQGDRDYLQAMLATGAERAKLLASAKQHYQDSVRANIAVILHYYLPQEIGAAVLPQGVARPDVNKLTLEQDEAAYQRMLAGLKTMQYDPDAEDRSDYQRYVDRAHARIKRIEQTH